MARVRSALIAVALATTALVGSAAIGVAATPAGGAWIAKGLGEVPRDPCVPFFQLKRCTRPGGLAAIGSDVTLLHMDRSISKFGDVDFAHTERSTNGGVNWSFGQVFETNVEGPDQTELPALAQRGSTLDAVLHEPSAFKPIHVYRSTDGGDDWTKMESWKQPRQLVTNLAVARGPGGRVAVVSAGYDEAIAGRDPVAVEVRVSSNGGDTFPRIKRITWDGAFCWVVDPVVAVTDGGVVVVAFWRTCRKLLVLRSTDGGATWSNTRLLDDGPHKMGMAMAADGNRVVLAYTSDGDTLTRRSNDGGDSWGAAMPAGSGAESLRLTYAGSAWRLLSAGMDRVRVRTSGNGASWSAGETVAESIGSRTYAIGVAFGTMPLAAYVIRSPDGTHRAYVARRP